jgi:hypothetical protein
MSKRIMNFDEFLEFLQSDESKEERAELEAYFNDLREKKLILSFSEWLQQQNRHFLFLTYDLINVADYPNRYAPINNYLSTLGFDRQINGRQLTNNSFVAFPSPINPAVLNAIGNILVAFFAGHLPEFRIYLNITSESEYFLHP